MSNNLNVVDSMVADAAMTEEEGFKDNVVVEDSLSQNRSSVPPWDDEDEVMFEIHSNRIDTVKFIKVRVSINGRDVTVLSSENSSH